jgi:hypothetical protein
MSEVWEIDYLDTKEKMVLLALADTANDDGVCWPKNSTLQKKCSLSVNPLGRCLKILQDVGLISSRRRSHVIEGAKSNLYQINHSHFYTGRKTEQVKLSRQKFKRKSLSYLHGAKNTADNGFKSDISTRVETNSKRLSQEEKVSSTVFDIKTESSAIADELETIRSPSPLGIVSEVLK